MEVHSLKEAFAALDNGVEHLTLKPNEDEYLHRHEWDAFLNIAYSDENEHPFWSNVNTYYFNALSH